MKAWLGNTVYEVTPEQMDEVNSIAQKTYESTGDHVKGLEAAIAHAKKNKFPVAKKVTVMKAVSGDVLPENEEKMKEIFREMMTEFKEELKNKK